MERFTGFSPQIKFLPSLFFCLVGRVWPTSEVQVLCGHQLPINPIAIPKPDYREVEDEGGLGIDRFKSDVRIKTVRGRDSEILALGTERY